MFDVKLKHNKGGINMNSTLTFKGLVTFYIFIACLTYALIIRVEGLENNNQPKNNNNYVINLWK